MSSRGQRSDQLVVGPAGQPGRVNPPPHLNHNAPHHQPPPPHQHQQQAQPDNQGQGDVGNQDANIDPRLLQSDQPRRLLTNLPLRQPDSLGPWDRVDLDPNPNHHHHHHQEAEMEEAALRALGHEMGELRARQLELQGEVEVLGELLTQEMASNAQLREEVAELRRQLVQPAEGEDDDDEDDDDEDDEDDESDEDDDDDDEDDDEDDEDRDEGEEEGQEAEAGDGGDEEEEEEEEDDDDDGDDDNAASYLPFVCGVARCNFSFKTQVGLDRHMATTHNSDPAGRRQHVCEICGASYDKAATLRKHRRRHEPANIAEYNAMRQPVPGGCPCPACGYNCVTRLNRLDHLGKLHKNWRQAFPNFQV